MEREKIIELILEQFDQLSAEKKEEYLAVLNRIKDVERK